jgi:uncharacterized protein
MSLAWDEPKRLANLLKHRLDFAEFADDFDFGTFVILETRRSLSGRVRWKMIGEMDGGKIVAAIVSPLGNEAISIVSLRQAHSTERRLYEKERQS